jgi:transcription termination/antitermination protein NusG
MAKKWYVVHTYSGFENKVKKSLEEYVRQHGEDRVEFDDKEDGKPVRKVGTLTECFGEVLIPMEQVVEMVKGEKKTSKRKFFPGYILVQMQMADQTWHMVKSTPKVTGFVGSAKNPRDVPAITDAEVARLTSQISEGTLKPKPRVQFEEGDQVRVIDGPFSNFNGTVEEVKPDKGKLRVLISIFGRATPVELDFVQVEKA